MTEPTARMYPILPYPDVDEAIAFNESLGFTRTLSLIHI